jgi:hypothetical protein
MTPKKVSGFDPTMGMGRSSGLRQDAKKVYRFDPTMGMGQSSSHVKLKKGGKTTTLHSITKSSKKSNW